MLDEWIIKIVTKLERNYRRGIYPWMVQGRLPVYRAEQTIRRDMVRLAEEGRLERVGEMGKSRMGYRLAKASNLRQEAETLDAQYEALKARLLGDRAVGEQYEQMRREMTADQPSPLAPLPQARGKSDVKNRVPTVVG